MNLWKSKKGYAIAESIAKSLKQIAEELKTLNTHEKPENKSKKTYKLIRTWYNQDTSDTCAPYLMDQGFSTEEEIQKYILTDIKEEVIELTDPDTADYIYLSDFESLAKFASEFNVALYYNSEMTEFELMSPLDNVWFAWSVITFPSEN